MKKKMSDEIYTMSNSMSRVERLAIRKKVYDEHAKHEKRKKFRGLAHKFLNWRQHKDTKT